MSETNTTKPAAPKRRSWPKILALICGGIFLLLIIAYFVGTSAAFLKGVILPKVGKAMNATITVGDASISPFSQVILRDLRVQTTGNEPLVIIPELRARYSLMSILRGTILVEEVAVTSPIITLVQNPDNTSNLDPITKSQAQQPKAPPQPKASSKPVQIDFRKVSLTDATVRTIKTYSNGNQDVTAISHLNFSLADLRNGQTGKMEVGADLLVSQNPPAPGANGVLEAKVAANFSLGLSADLKPSLVQGNSHVTVTRAEGAMAQAAGITVGLDCDLSPTEIRQVALKLQKNSTTLATLLAQGPFNMETTEGKIAVQLFGIDKTALNMAGAAAGLDFGPTSLNSSNEIQLAKGGKLITINGQLNLNHLQVTRTNQTTPALDFHGTYDLTVDQAASNATVRVLNLQGVQNGTSFMHSELDKPLPISWSPGAGAGDATLNFAITDFDLANWKAFLAQVAPAGVLNASGKLVSQNGGNLLNVSLDSELKNLTAGSGSNQINQAAVTFKLRTQASDMNKFTVSELGLNVARLGQQLASLSVSGTYDKKGEQADFNVTGQAQLANLLKALPQPGSDISSGTAEFKSHIVQQKQTLAVTGNFALTNLKGTMAGSSFQDYQAGADFDIAMPPSVVEIRKLAGQLAEGKNPGGTFSVSGTYNLTNKVAKLVAKLDGFNQNALRPFLQSALGDKTLVSVALNGNADVNFDPAGASAIKSSLAITNLVVSDPKGQFPTNALAMAFSADVGMNKAVTDLRSVQITLTPTARANNRVDITGKIDQTVTNAMVGNVKITSDALDLTTYYDLFGGKTAAKESAGTSASPPSVAGGSGASSTNEPGPIKLPIKTFTAEASIGHFYLRETEVTNFQAVVKINGNQVVVDPFKFALNGAPASAAVNADLGEPGFKYSLVLNADRLPLAPLANTFDPDHKNRVGGTVSAQANIHGVGVTGPNLRKNLGGQFGFATTNLNLSVGDVRNPLLRSLINVVTILPDLVSNPASAPASLLGAFGSKLGGGGATTQTGGLSGDLAKSPINQIVIRGGVTNGIMQLDQAMVQSPAFQADATGTVTLADILTNSAIQIPVALSLSRPVAERIKMVPANTPTNAAYVKMPDFLTMSGTMGQPKSDINKLALASAVLSRAGAAGVGGANTGNLLQNLGGVLGGKSGTTTTNNNTPAGTNAPANSTGNLIQGLGNILGSHGTTPNTVAPNTTTNRPATNNTPAGNLLNQFFGPGKK